MTQRDIRELVQAWGQAARRADEAEFDVVEVHGAHGYLIHQFLSRVANRRTDEYGGSAENRMRFAAEVIQEVRKHWPQENRSSSARQPLMRLDGRSRTVSRLQKHSKQTASMSSIAVREACRTPSPPRTRHNTDTRSSKRDASGAAPI
jgi:2,4-dienoyl-CoA reductase-like NADH-dependent reductase (Old Yellow Enzyme family)